MQHRGTVSRGKARRCKGYGRPGNNTCDSELHQNPLSPSSSSLYFYRFLSFCFIVCFRLFVFLSVGLSYSYDFILISFLSLFLIVSVSALTCFSVMSYCRGPCNSLFLSLICLSKSSPSLPHLLLFFLHPPSFQLMLYKSLSIIPTLSVVRTPYPCLSQSI